MMKIINEQVKPLKEAKETMWKSSRKFLEDKLKEEITSAHYLGDNQWKIKTASGKNLVMNYYYTGNDSDHSKAANDMNPKNHRWSIDKEQTKKLEEDTMPIANSKLNFKAAGFVRAPELDFTDDGNRFSGYLFKGKLPMTYCRYNGEAFISLRPDYMKLNYDEYSKLPAYKDADKYNGVRSSEVDLTDLANIADKLLSEIEALQSSFKPASSKDWDAHAKVYGDFYTNLYDKARNLIKDNFDAFMDLSDWKQKNIKQYLGYLKHNVTRWTDSYKNDDLSGSYVRGELGNKDRQSKETSNFEDNFYYKQIREYLTGK